MWWFFSFLLALLFLFALILWWRERKYLKKKTSEVLSESLWKEIEQERQTSLDQRRKFREAMHQALKKK